MRNLSESAMRLVTGSLARILYLAHERARRSRVSARISRACASWPCCVVACIGRAMAALISAAVSSACELKRQRIAIWVVETTTSCFLPFGRTKASSAEPCMFSQTSFRPACDIV
eukprot:Amastigsp_a512712_22.p4 type:complete len:115 gc:universal Amastigsp_a512712_22:521-865(+)